MLCPLVPYDPGRWPAGRLDPTCVVLHRTYGKWQGDYTIGKNGRGSLPIGFHFLIGKEEKQVAQFYDTNTVCYHAKGANSRAIGIEITGKDNEPLTDWQVRCLRLLIVWITTVHPNIVRQYNDGARERVFTVGFQAHRSVPGSDHTDYVSNVDWGRALAPTRHAVKLGDVGHDVDSLRVELMRLVPARMGEVGPVGAPFGAGMAALVRDLGFYCPDVLWSDGSSVSIQMWQALDALVTLSGSSIVD